MSELIGDRIVIIDALTRHILISLLLVLVVPHLLIMHHLLLDQHILLHLLLLESIIIISFVMWLLLIVWAVVFFIVIPLLFVQILLLNYLVDCRVVVVVRDARSGYRAGSGIFDAQVGV